MTAETATPAAAQGSGTESGKKPFLDLKAGEWLWPVIFMLGMSMIGLKFPLGYLVVAISFLHTFIHDRYSLIIMLTIYVGGYSLATFDETFASRKVVFYVCLGLMIFLRKYPLLNKIILAFFAYWLALSLFALNGYTSYSAQFGDMLNHLVFCWFVVPLAIFAGQEFDMREFFRRTVPFAIIACIFYFIDGVVLGGLCLLPRDPFWSTPEFPAFYDLRLHPFSLEFVRRWPPALYLLILSLYPMMKYYRLRRWMWAAIVMALIITRTFSVMLGFMVVAIILRENKRAMARTFLLLIGIITALYFIDGALGEAGENGSTTLRVKSQIDQLTGISAIQGDDEALADMATGRGAQILPSLELWSEKNREMFGFGFLSQDETPHTLYINSEYIEEEEKAERLVTDVESEPFVVLLQTGYVGLLVHYGFFVVLWLMVRRLRYSQYFLSVVIFFAISGLMAFSGLYRQEGLYLVGLSLASVILANKSRKEEKTDTPALQ